MKKTVIVLLSTIIFSSCATIFIPKKQKVTVNTGQEKAIIYIDKEESGQGGTITARMKKENGKQIIIKTPGYKDQYNVLIPTHRVIAWWPLLILSIPTCLGFLADGNDNPKFFAYDKVNTFTVKEKIINKKLEDKYIDISNIRLSIKDKELDIVHLYVKNSTDDLLSRIEEAEKDHKMNKIKEDSKKKKKGKALDEDNKKINYDDIKYTENVFTTLKQTGFVDTINKVFADNNNTLVLEGNINKIYYYTISGASDSYSKVKFHLTWYIKNTYNEILDSIETKEMSGDFLLKGNGYYSTEDQKKSYTNDLNKMNGDAIDIAYLKLFKNARFTTLLKRETDLNINESVLNLNKVSAPVKEKTDAAFASVIVKRASGGHGSGFAISNDGYILTNYHVVASKMAGKLEIIKVITSDGDELEGTVVRVNKFRDLALIKVNKKFEKAFVVPNVKTFKNLQDVYTIGTPISIELGQSVSSGVISNERKVNNNNLLQLGMSVNGGNSGGPLYDASGNLHGVIVSKLVGKNTEGVSFAIPSYMIEDYLKLKIN